MKPKVSALMVVSALVLLAGNSIAQQAKPTLQGSLRLTEAPKQATSRQLSATEHLRRVDSRSRIEIDFDHDMVMRTAARHAGPGAGLPDEEPANVALRETGAELLGVLKDYLARWHGLGRDMAAFRADGTGDVDELSQRITAIEKDNRKFIEAAKKAVLAQAEAAGWSVEETTDPLAEAKYKDEKTQKLYAEVSNQLYPKGQPLNAEVMAKLLNDQFDFISEDMREALSNLKRDQETLLSVRALLLQASAERPLPLHVQNYDTFDAGGGPDRKGMLGISQAELEELARRYAVVGDFAQFANDLRDSQSEIRRTLSSSVDKMRSRIDALDQDFEKIFPPGWDQQFVGKVNALLKDYANQTGVDTGVESELVASLNATWVEIEKARSALRALKPNADDTPITLLNRIGTAQESLKNVKTTFDTIIPKLSQIPADLAKIRDKVQEISSGEVMALRGRARGVLTGWRSDLESSGQSVVAELQKYPEVFTALDNLYKLARGNSVETELADSINDYEQIRPRPLEDIVPGAIVLSDYVTKHGDQVRIIVELVRQEETGYETVESAELRLEIQQFGFFRTLDSHLIFVERIDDPAGVEPQSGMLASPSLSFTAHYRKREEEGQSHSWAKFWNFINPGVGVNVAALSFEGSSGQYGVGFHVTLIGDVLQAGYGWNLNVDTENEYWFLGIGLIDALNLAGTAVTSVTQR